MRGAYKIGTAARLTGIDAMTLRNWERRYGVVVAGRGAGRQRAYAPEDLDRLRWLKEAIDSGLSAGEAHELLRQRLDAGHLDPTAPRARERARQLRSAAAQARERAQQSRTKILALREAVAHEHAAPWAGGARRAMQHGLER
jgi:DNA-binding transcriptional MerR regulator